MENKLMDIISSKLDGMKDILNIDTFTLDYLKGVNDSLKQGITFILPKVATQYLGKDSKTRY